MATNRVFSNEDGKLNEFTLINARDKLYKDIDLSFAAKPSGEIFKKQDAAAVKQAVKNLLLTNHLEKPFEPNFGGNLRGLLFELADEDIDDEIVDDVVYAIERYEPRARILNISVSETADYNSISIKIEFQVTSTEETVELNTTLSRLR